MSAFAQILRDKKEITVSARLFFYGSEATESLGQAAVDEIVSMWNEPKGALLIGKEAYTVVFEVAFALIPYQDLLILCPSNRDHRNNFIRIESANRLSRSMMGFGLGDNSGHWLSTDQLGHSTTAAHEFGHALGLPHPSKVDYRGLGAPPLMAPRGTLVDAEYQWDPRAEASAYGGTMKPHTRRVSLQEITDIFENHTFDTSSFYRIGRLSNLIFDEKANPIRLA